MAAFLGPLFKRRWPTPILKPMGPFIISGFVMMYAINAAANAMMETDEFKNDPRNPNLRKSGGAH